MVRMDFPADIEWRVSNKPVAYTEAVSFMEERAAAIREGTAPECVWLLEHPPLFTAGTSADPAELTNPLDFPIFEAGRGGRYTYHGPGQLIGYPILDLRPDRCDVHKYVRDLEDVMIRAAGSFAVRARRVQGLTGAWVGADKLGAIGVRIARWITSHGFAFNVTTDLEYFNLIVPCGITSGGVTSLARATGRPVGMGDAESAIVQRFCDVFDRELVSERAELATGQPSEPCKQRAASGAGRRGPRD